MNIITWKWVCLPQGQTPQQAHHIDLSDGERFIKQDMHLLLTNSIFLFTLVEQIQFNEEYKVLKIHLPLIV